MTIFRSFLAIFFPILIVIICAASALPEIEGKLKAESRDGNAVAQYELAQLYFEGEALPKDMDKAIYWVSKSAEQGNPDAQHALGILSTFAVQVLIRTMKRDWLSSGLPQSRIRSLPSPSWPISMQRVSVSSRTLFCFSAGYRKPPKTAMSEVSSTWQCCT